MSASMDTYWDKLNDEERNAVEVALDALKDHVDFKLAGDDRAARAAEALAVYIVESKR